ncbi:MAG: hypothetical protein V3U54_12755 [Thermodesulfobacteriota bacterium]
MNSKRKPETPEEALDLLLENLNNISHCCECERGIEHYVCMQYCKASSEENCIYEWVGNERIVQTISDDKEHAYVQVMTFAEWKIWVKTHKIINYGDLGLASP